MPCINLFSDSAVSNHTVLVAAWYFIQLFQIYKEVLVWHLDLLNKLLPNRPIFIIFVNIFMFFTLRKCNCK